MALLDFLKTILIGPPVVEQAPVREAAGFNGLQDEDETGWTRLTAEGGSYNRHDLTPLSQDRMQRVAEYLWQSNLLANRLIEIPLAYLLAEGVKLQCKDEAHQKLLNAFWLDPINSWPLKLQGRVRDLALHGEQCYQVFANEHSGHVRLGYVDPRRIGEVVLDPDNPEQPIGVITRRDKKNKYLKYRVLVAGSVPDEELFSVRTAQIRATFTDGDVFLFQVNKLATGSRGRSDMLAQMDWLDAYDEFLFGELDRSRYLRAFVWDLNVKTATPEQVKQRAKEFQPPNPNSVYVHNDGEELNPKSPTLNAADSAEGARLFRNHVLGGSTTPEHWFGGGGNVNLATASAMGEPTFKLMTARQTYLKLMLEEIGRFVLASQPDAQPDWGDDKWQVTAVFPELLNKDVTVFATAMQQVATAVLLLVDRGLLTEERALALVADIAQRFGQEIDVKAELAAARAAKAAKEGNDVFGMPPDLRGQAGKAGDANANANADPAAA